MNCTECTMKELPFLSVRDLNTMNDFVAELAAQDVSPDRDLEILNENRHLLSIGHLNTQSMVSTFDEFLLFMNKYQFDVMTLSETWLKNNQDLLNYVNIPGYQMLYENRHVKRGGGVGIYIKDNILNTNSVKIS